MRPVPIPDELVWPGGRHRVIAPPDGDLTNPDIAPVDTIVDDHGIHLRLMLDDGDLEKLERNPHVWLTMHTNQLPVFAIGLEADAQ